jgi:hypothetical protein
MIDTTPRPPLSFHFLHFPRIIHTNIYRISPNSRRVPFFFFKDPFLEKSRDRAVGMDTGYRLYDRRFAVLVPVRSRIFSTSSRPALGPTQPHIQWVWVVKRPGREADHSPPASVEMKRTWIYTSDSPYVFMAQCLII